MTRPTVAWPFRVRNSSFNDPLMMDDDPCHKVELTCSVHSTSISSPDGEVLCDLMLEGSTKQYCGSLG